MRPALALCSRRWIPVAALVLCLSSGAAALAKPASPTFKASSWKVGTGGPVSQSQQPFETRSVKPGGSLTVCSMRTIASVTLNFSFRNAPTRAFDAHGRAIFPFTYVFSGPGGSQKQRYATPGAGRNRNQATGKDLLIFAGSSSFPGFRTASTPIPAGRYAIEFKQGSRRLMTVSITFKSTNSC